MSEAQRAVQTGSVPDRVTRATDFELRLMMDGLVRRLSELDFDPAEVLASFPAEALGLSAEEALAWSERTEVAEVRVGAEVAVPLVRLLLRSAWEVAALRPAVEVAVMSPADDRLGSGVTFKVGALATALMLVASTSFDVRLPGVVVHKDPLSAEVIRALAELLGGVRAASPRLRDVPRSLPRRAGDPPS